MHILELLVTTLPLLRDCFPSVSDQKLPAMSLITTFTYSSNSLQITAIPGSPKDKAKNSNPTNDLPRERRYLPPSAQYSANGSVTVFVAIILVADVAVFDIAGEGVITHRLVWIVGNLVVGSWRRVWKDDWRRFCNDNRRSCGLGMDDVR